VIASAMVEHMREVVKKRSLKSGIVPLVSLVFLLFTVLVRSESTKEAERRIFLARGFAAKPEAR
jgi:hypothetical protein